MTDGSFERIAQGKAIFIAETYVKKETLLQKGRTLRSEARYDDKKGGWRVIVWLVPAESGGHWSIFVTKSGKVAEVHPGA